MKLVFCGPCGDKPLKYVKNQLQKLFHSKWLPINYCGICLKQLGLDQNPPQSSENGNTSMQNCKRFPPQVMGPKVDPVKDRRSATIDGNKAEINSSKAHTVETVGVPFKTFLNQRSDCKSKSEDTSLKNNLNMSLYKCEFCKCVFKSELVLKYHIRRRHGEDKKVQNQMVLRMQIKSMPVKSKQILKQQARIVQRKNHLKSNLRNRNSNSSKAKLANNETKLKIDNRRCSKAKTKNSKKSKHVRLRRYEPCKLCHRLICTSNLGRHLKVPHPFNYDKCNKSFVNSDYLIDHLVVIHNLEKSYKCTDCEQFFATLKAMVNHKVGFHHLDNDTDVKQKGLIVGEIAKKSRQHACSRCSKIFRRRSGLNQHIRRVHEGYRPFKCKRCWKTFSTESEFTHHSIKTPMCELRLRIKYDRADIPCETCGKVFCSTSSLNQHIRRIHEGIRPFTCEKCAKAFATLYDLRSHNKLNPNCQAHVNVKLPCKLCGEVFNFRKGLDRHMRRQHHGIRTFKCEKCDKYFTTTDSLKKHQYVHETTKSFMCEVCGKCFKVKQLLCLHIGRVHSGNINSSDGKQRTHKCNICEKSFSRKDDLEKHKKNVHGPKIPCHICGLLFSGRPSLKKHINRKHEANRPHSCSGCEKTFADPEDLASHKMVHQTEKPFKCDHCGKCFKGKAHLKYHKATHLSPYEKPFKCKLCDYKASSSSLLIVHNRSKHTGERPYKCNNCGEKAYVQMGNLKKHMAKCSKRPDVKAFPTQFEALGPEVSTHEFPLRESEVHVNPGIEMVPNSVVSNHAVLNPIVPNPVVTNIVIPNPTIGNPVIANSMGSNHVVTNPAVVPSTMVHNQFISPQSVRQVWHEVHFNQDINSTSNLNEM